VLIDGVYVNGSTCDTCSGLGACVLRQCQCRSYPVSGPWAGKLLVAGSDCSCTFASLARSSCTLSVRTRAAVTPYHWVLSEGGVGLSIFLAVLDILVAVVASATYFFFRRHPVMRMTRCPLAVHARTRARTSLSD
jgi:hypothetical protein